MRTAYLPIRSFGDFIITASVIKANYWTRVPVILPPYLVDIFDAISGDDLFEIIDTIDYDDQPAFFELYTVRDLPNLKRLLHDMRTIRKFVKKDEQYILDYSSKRLFFSGGKFAWPQRGKNIYRAKKELLANKGLIAAADHPELKITPPEPGQASA